MKRREDNDDFRLKSNDSIFHQLTKNSHSFCHKKTDKTHSFAKRGRARAQERRELVTLCAALRHKFRAGNSNKRANQF